MALKIAVYPFLLAILQIFVDLLGFRKMFLWPHKICLQVCVYPLRQFVIYLSLQPPPIAIFPYCLLNMLARTFSAFAFASAKEPQ